MGAGYCCSKVPSFLFFFFLVLFFNFFFEGEQFTESFQLEARSEAGFVDRFSSVSSDLGLFSSALGSCGDCYHIV